MPDAALLRPAMQDEIAETLSFTLRYSGRRRMHDADDAMGRITAERLVAHLEASGFVVMKVRSRAARRSNCCKNVSVELAMIRPGAFRGRS